MAFDMGNDIAPPTKCQPKKIGRLPNQSILFNSWMSCYIVSEGVASIESIGTASCELQSSV